MRYGAYTKLHFMVFRDHLPTLKLNGSPNTYTLKSISGETYLGGTYGTKVANMMFYTDEFYRGDMIEHVGTYEDRDEFVIRSFRVGGTHRDQGLYIEVSDSLTGRVKAKILETSTLTMENKVSSVTSGFYFNTNERINLKLLSLEQQIEAGLWRHKNHLDDKLITDNYNDWIKTLPFVQDITGKARISQQLRPNQTNINIVKSVYVEPYTGTAFISPV